MKPINLTYQKPENRMQLMKVTGFIFVLLFSFVVSAQNKEDVKAKEQKLQKANNFVYEGNTLIESDDFIAAEMEYRKAISEQSSNVAGTYNLGNSYYSEGNYDEALFRHTQAAEKATLKGEKHKAYHNIGNILMQRKLCRQDGSLSVQLL